jgi:tetratricopeptide (TPR) repeat protein
VLRLADAQLDLHIAAKYLEQARLARAAGDLHATAAALGSALELWQGTPLGNVPGPLAEIERARLAGLRLDILEDLAETQLSLGGAVGLADELSALVAEHPFRERLAGLQMRALHQAGRQAEALAVYTQTRTLLAEELGIDPGPELQQLQLRILSGDPEPASLHDGGSHAGLPMPRQLPADIAHFTGRVAQLRELIALLDTSAGAAGTVVIGAIDGMGGVGKSALAIHAAHQLTATGRFPDGQLYVDLQGATPGLDPLDPLEALGRMLRALGIDAAQIPSQINEAAALLRTLVAERLLLIVLDNAHDCAQVRPLLPASPACGVLVTSRQVLATLDLNGSRPVHLDVLSETEALELLGRLVGWQRVEADRDAAVDVVRCCGYLPLAVRVAAARLAARPGWSVRELAGRLTAADAARRLEELTAGELGVLASFDVSLSALKYSPDPADQAAAHAFGLLCLPDGPDIDVMAAAALLDEPERASQILLERLVDAQSLQTPQPGRYRFHDLLRLYARQHASSQNPEDNTGPSAAMTRLLGFYTATAWNTLALLRPGDHRLGTADPRWADAGRHFPDTTAALGWLEAERANLLAVIAQAAATPVIPGELAVQLASALYGFFLVHGYWADGSRADQTALELACRVRDRTAQARAHNDLGIFCRLLGHYQQALSHHQQSFDLARELGDLRGQARSLDSLGSVYWRLGRYQDAITCHQHSLALARECGDQRDQASSLGNLGIVYELVGRYDEAIACHRDSVVLFRQLGDRRGQGGSLTNLGRVYEQLGRYQEAAACQHDSLRLFQKLGDRPGEAVSLNSLGRVYQQLGRYEDAVACQDDSLRLFHELGERHGEAEALRDLGDALLAFGHPRRARHAWHKALTIFQALQVPEADRLQSRLTASSPKPPRQAAL